MRAVRLRREVIASIRELRRTEDEVPVFGPIYNRRPSGRAVGIIVHCKQRTALNRGLEEE